MLEGVISREGKCNQESREKIRSRVLSTFWSVMLEDMISQWWWCNQKDKKRVRSRESFPPYGGSFYRVWYPYRSVIRKVVRRSGAECFLPLWRVVLKVWYLAGSYYQKGGVKGRSRAFSTLWRSCWKWDITMVSVIRTVEKRSGAEYFLLYGWPCWREWYPNVGCNQKGRGKVRSRIFSIFCRVMLEGVIFWCWA